MENITEVRRKNREVGDEQWMREYLARAKTCVIGTSDGEHVFLNPTLFVYDAEAHVVYFHTAGQGRTRANIEKNPAITFCTYELGDLVPGPRAVDFSVYYASVVIFGKATIITDPGEVRSVFKRQMQKYAPDHESGRDYVPFTDEDAARATVYRIAIEGWSAKRHAPAEKG